jgi:precorrin-6B methylase 2
MDIKELEPLLAQMQEKMKALEATLPDPNVGGAAVPSPEMRAAQQAKVQELQAMAKQLEEFKPRVPRKPRKPRKPALHTDGGSLGPVARSHPYVVEKMLEAAELKQDDILYDIGSGDGRIVLEAADRYRIQAGGIEINPWWVRYAREWALMRGLKSYVDFLEADALTVNLSRATVVTLHLSREGNLKIALKLLKELRPGARIVSNAFDMGNWQPDHVVQGLDHRNRAHPVYVWHITDRERHQADLEKEIWEGL